MVDGANLLSVSQRRALSNQLVDAEKRSKHQFVVVTVKSLGGHDVADYSQRLGTFWGIGRKCFNDGVLLVIAPNERKARIAVSEGLREALTDAEAGAILEKDILPRFKTGDMPGGILAGSDAIIREITQ
ncbi:TPM domain-containing protein [Sphingomonas sp. KR3-1]|uniref:TPM domain-containing protein n=1 Tax=Sphingomonas sp. KR3-1 TaxID=3156611 RepID=UPI0032B4DADF